MRIKYLNRDFKHSARVCVCVRVRIRTRTHTHAHLRKHDDLRSILLAYFVCVEGLCLDQSCLLGVRPRTDN